MTPMIFHYPPTRISVGIDITSSGMIYGTVAACNPKDMFSKKVAYRILTERLRAKRKSVKLIGQCDLDDPDLQIGRDIYHPIRDFIRTLTARRNVDIYDILTHSDYKDIYNEYMNLQFTSVARDILDKLVAVTEDLSHWQKTNYGNILRELNKVVPQFKKEKVEV